VCWRAYKRRLRILETDYGREAGWFVELEGRAVAQLTEPRFEDMFWDSYRLEPLTGDAELRRQILTKPFWDDFSRLTFRSCEFGDAVPQAWPAGDVFTEDGRVKLRGLYLTVRPSWLWPWEWPIIWWRRRSNPPGAECCQPPAVRFVYTRRRRR
jgi:hypothetical protein